MIITFLPESEINGEESVNITIRLSIDFVCQFKMLYFNKKNNANVSLFYLSLNQQK